MTNKTISATKEFEITTANELSCGFVIVNKKGQILASHPTGAKIQDGYWNIPKGHIEEGETPLEAAKRELMEEANITIPDDAEIYDCGRMKYTKKKDLYLFVVKMDVDLSKVYCASTFYDKRNDCWKCENDAFTFTNNITTFTPSLAYCVEDACNMAIEAGFTFDEDAE